MPAPTSRVAEVYQLFRDAGAGRTHGWWLMSSDVVAEFWQHHVPFDAMLLGRPVRLIDGVDVLRFVGYPRPPARKHRKLRLR